MSTTPNYDINYEDERFQQVETDKQSALTEVRNTYDEMINQSDGFYDAQIQASKDWADQQQQIQQEQTDFAIEQIEQQKDQAEKDYKKEQSAAYVDYQKESNKYGASAEQMAASGLAGTGYSESSKTGMYNTYQNRVAVARESFNQANINFSNAIKEAQLQNSSAQAEIAYKAYVQQLELALQGFQYKNQLLLEQQNQLQTTEDKYHSRWQDVYNQIQQENAFAESVRQYEQNFAYQKEQDRIAQEQWRKEHELAQKTAEEKEAEEQETEESEAWIIDNENDVASVGHKDVRTKIAEQAAFREAMLGMNGSTSSSANTAIAALESTSLDVKNAGKSSGTSTSNITALDVASYLSKTNATSKETAEYLATLVNSGKLTKVQANQYYASIANIKGW